MLMDHDVSTIAHVIQLAIAPVFLLTGIGSLLSVMANRLARIIDRSRVVENRWNSMNEGERADAGLEFANLSRRAGYTSWAINFGALSALLVCALIAALFVDALLGSNLRWVVGALFILSMVALSVGILYFLREVHTATHTLRIGPPSRADSVKRCSFPP